MTRRTIVERPVVVEPRRVVREVIVERPVIYRPPPVVREVVVERPIVYRPRREVIVERDGFYGPRRFGLRPVGYGYGPAFDPYGIREPSSDRSWGSKPIAFFRRERRPVDRGFPAS